MIMSLFVIAVTLGIAYLWATRGFFSALLHMACVVVAGAIALALWEPIAFALLGMAPRQGFLSFLEGVSWALALALPFAVSLAVLRVIVDTLVRANANTSSMYNYIGGGFCGLVSGVITSGILVLAMGFTRTPPTLLGYDRISYADEGARGNLTRKKTLILPTDDLVAAFYSHLSEGVLSVPEPLADWYPNLADVPSAMRLTSDDGGGRNAIRTDDFRVASTYSITGRQSDLVEDAWTDAPQNVAYLNGDRPPENATLRGYVVDFQAGARETTGQVIMGAGQLRLLVRDSRGKTQDIYPYAVVAQSDAKDVQYVRYRYDAADVFLASLGGATTTKMAFEFLTPTDAEPVALYVRNVRVDTLPQEKPYTSVGERDRAIRSGSIVGGSGGGGEALDNEAAETVEIDQADGSRAPSDFPEMLIRTRLKDVLQKGTFSGLSIGSQNEILSGETKIAVEAVGRGGLEKTLQVRELAVTPDTVIVQLDVGPDSRTSILGRAVSSAERLGAPALIDTNGQRYDALGFIYKDRDEYQLRYTPGNPLRALQETPQIARTRQDQELTLIFRPTRGVSIASFVVGNRVVTEFSPAIILDQQQSNR